MYQLFDLKMWFCLTRQGRPAVVSLSDLVMSTRRSVFAVVVAAAVINMLELTSVTASADGFSCDRFQVKGVEYDMSNVS